MKAIVIISGPDVSNENADPTMQEIEKIVDQAGGCKISPTGAVNSKTGFLNLAVVEISDPATIVDSMVVDRKTLDGLKRFAKANGVEFQP